MLTLINSLFNILYWGERRWQSTPTKSQISTRPSLRSFSAGIDNLRRLNGRGLAMHPHGRQPVSVGMEVIRATLPPHPSSVRVSRSRGLKPRWCAQVQRVHGRNTISSQPGGLPRQWLPGHSGRSGYPWLEEKQGVKYNRILTNTTAKRSTPWLSPSPSSRSKTTK